MASQQTISDRILDIVKANPDSTLDSVTQEMPDLHWSDVFMEVDRLNRLGRLRLVQNISLRATSIYLP